MKAIVSLILMNILLCEAYVWIQLNPSASLPQDCGVGGQEIYSWLPTPAPLFIARVSSSGSIVTGKYVESWKKIYAPLWSDEKEFTSGEILCGGTKMWESAPLNPTRHVPGGNSANGEIYYVCQASSSNGQLKTPGTYKPSTGNCCYPANGKENCQKDNFMLLVNNC